MADLAGQIVVVPEAEELVALGAAVQAASILTSSTAQDVAAAWGLGIGQITEPDPAVDGRAIRAACAEVCR